MSFRTTVRTNGLGFIVSKFPRGICKTKLIALGTATTILDPRSTHFLDWLSSSGTTSNLRQLRLDDLMLIDHNIIAAVDGIIRAAQVSSKLEVMWLSFGPDVDLTPRECRLSCAALLLTRLWC